MAEMASSTAKPSAPKAKAETISNRQIAMQMATKHNLTKKQAKALLRTWGQQALSPDSPADSASP